ncbi:hypothetical protein VNI00_017219 [Paramarasmius palmivorus]|uniref:F-box domain-containing protein n=1 Tax=Paramarasmius palmivorus TaxID=297713 RepID=A0AAW0B6V3_9AGAR
MKVTQNSEILHSSYAAEALQWNARMSLVPGAIKAVPSSDISRLPNELFCEIFKHFISQRPRDKFRITLTHVCRRWRIIAISVHERWACPVFYAPFGVAKEMLKRSGQAPLHIYYTHYEHSGYFKIPPREVLLARLEPLLEALSHFPRLETVELNIPSDPLEELLESGWIDITKHALHSVR